ncbi:MAG: flagellar hook protein FlgE [Burkholderiales bacterium]|nr:flagellar hook protein FlgE [Burkholderiales bacterium]
MSFQQGLSGLNAAARNLDVIGHNVANANTVGAKSSRAEFADVYANSLYGASAVSPGIGTTVAAVAQQFTQGDISSTNNALDIAVSGQGFFRISDGGEITYTRNGQFRLDNEGYIINAQGGRLTGYPANDIGEVNPGMPVELKLQTRDVAPRATDAAVVTVNLASTATVPTAPFSVNNGSTYSGAVPLGVYDSQGGDHTVTMYFRKTGDNTWDVYAATDGTLMNSGAAVGTFTFDVDGRLATTSPTTLTLNVPVPAAVGGTLTVPIDMSKMTQQGSSFSVFEQSQTGYAPGRLAGFSVGADGTIMSRYTNGQTLAQGQVVLANFANPQGLLSLGGNQWVETSDSGVPLVGAPGTGSLGDLKSGALEQSNVDLTAELVNMITAQRVYQANAQTIRAQDQLLQTIVNLR